MKKGGIESASQVRPDESQQNWTEEPTQQTTKLGLRKSAVNQSAPGSAQTQVESPRQPQSDPDTQATVPVAEIDPDQVVPAPQVRRVGSSGARRSLRKVNFAQVRTEEPFVRGEYFIEFISQNLPIIESMSYLDAYNFVTLVAHEFRFTHVQTLEILEKFQRENQIVPIFQILIQLYDTYVVSRSASPVNQLRQMYTALVRLFEAPALRNETARLEVLEITRKIFNLSRSQFFQMRSEFLN